MEAFLGRKRGARQKDNNPQMSDVVSWKLVSSVVIWFRLTQSMSTQEVEESRSVLSFEERARADRFAFDRDRRDFIAAHALLRGALSYHGGLTPDVWSFASEATGKPYLVGHSELQFNIAHTRGLVACALSITGPVGIDVESIDIERDIESVWENNFASSEITELKACEEGGIRQARFTELWTLKEAYLKALGTGLGQPLDEIAFRFPGASRLRGVAKDNSSHAGWRFGLFAPLDNYRLAVAVRANKDFVLFARSWPDDRERPSLVPTRVSAAFLS
jgi:4'-phosphopantetheinyl transferase